MTVNKDSTTAEIGTDRVPTRRDSGVTFVELLVSIVLLGVAVVAVLAAVGTTTVASRIDGDHARAFEWLQAASDSVYDTPRISCTRPVDGAYEYADDDLPSEWTSNKAAVTAAYAAAVAATPRPTGWSGATITVTSIEYLGRATPTTAAFDWSTTYCFEGVQTIAGDTEDFRESAFLSQKVNIQVTSPDGDVVKTIHTVKGD